MKSICKLSIFAFLFTLTSCGVMGSASSSANQETLNAKMATIRGQYQTDEEGVYAQKVFEVSGTKDDLYLKLLEFLNQTYNDASEVIQVKEKEDGLIICKGCHKFNVSEIMWGSAIEQTIWHVYKAEIKDNKVRVTITLDDVEWYRPASVGYMYIPSDKGRYSLFECPPYKTYKEEKENLRRGYVFYHAVSNIVYLMQATEKTLLETSRFNSDDNW